MLSYCLMVRAHMKAAAVGESEALCLTEMWPSADSYLAVHVWQSVVADLLPRKWNCLCINSVSQWKYVPAWCSQVVKIM